MSTVLKNVPTDEEIYDFFTQMGDGKRTHTVDSQQRDEYGISHIQITTIADPGLGTWTARYERQGKPGVNALAVMYMTVNDCHNNPEGEPWESNYIDGRWVLKDE